MRQYIIELTEEEVKALEAEIADPEALIANFAHDRARKAMDRVVVEYTNLNPAKLDRNQKNEILKNAHVKTFKEKFAEHGSIE